VDRMRGEWAEIENGHHLDELRAMFRPAAPPH
jgi:hypothetical protein